LRGKIFKGKVNHFNLDARIHEYLIKIFKLPYGFFLGVVNPSITPLSSVQADKHIKVESNHGKVPIYLYKTTIKINVL
jgi:hypothetical protein